MQIEFGNEDLDRLEVEPGFTLGLPAAVVVAYRRRIQSIRAATDERDLRAVRGNRFKQLQGDRSHQYSIRLNDQFRLIVEIRSGSPKNTIVVASVEDYH